MLPKLLWGPLAPAVAYSVQLGASQSLSPGPSRLFSSLLRPLLTASHAALPGSVSHLGTLASPHELSEVGPSSWQALARPSLPCASRAGSPGPLKMVRNLSHSVDVKALTAGVLEGDRLSISRAITLCESLRQDHMAQAAQLLTELSLARSAAAAASGSNEPLKEAFKLGVSGPPGAGKSTLIEALCTKLLQQGEVVGVLAVDPSSRGTGGAILGDKTRMPTLATHPNAYVRPSAARGTLGGIARATFDAMQVLEAARFSWVVIETVGVGQSETDVADLVDCMLLVLPPVGGDDLQMIKRGIMEVADVIVVNKADGPTEAAAKAVAMEQAQAVKLMPRRYNSWEAPVHPVSARSGANIGLLADELRRFSASMAEAGELAPARARRRAAAMATMMQDMLLGRLEGSKYAQATKAALLPDVQRGSLPVRAAAMSCVDAFLKHAGK